ncbi:hypothetical protein C2E23DRAFT_920634 [Lenzites betulinus]|nr:hypothetical protein C2E23DRAFT_920634 [Lenzites betulinus]
MDRRGRSRDVSPVARARNPDFALAPARIPDYAFPHAPPRPPPAFALPTFFPDTPPTRPAPVTTSPYSPGPSKPSYTDSRDRINRRAQPFLSTSPTDTLPRTHSSSSVLSTSSEPSAREPLTPPDAVCTYACERPLEYYDSPPSPPRTLQDQMHVAYALDHMHLAKVLLLKIRGVEVSGDDDPRIAQVRDEDFSSSFVPAGGLQLDDATAARVQEEERRAAEAQRARRREERLRKLERKWENSSYRLKTEKERIARQRDEEARMRRRADLAARERERERARKEEAARAARSSQLRIASGHPRQLLCYDSLRNADARFPKPSAPREREEDCTSGLFLYDIMPSPPSRPLSLSRSLSTSPNDKDALSLPRAQRELALQHARSVSRSVPFGDVLTAMHGPLFIDDVNCRPHARPTAQQAELLAILLEPTEVEQPDAKGKGRAALVPKTRRKAHVKDAAVLSTARSSTLDSVSSASSGTSSSSASTVTRSGSWFSFGSRNSFRSASTALTTPSSSPRTPTKPILPSSDPLSTSPPPLSPARAPSRSAKQPIAPTVPAAEHPLALPAPPKPRSREALAIGRGRPLTRRAGHPGTSDADDRSPPRASGLVHRVSRSVSTLMDFAAQFQKAYVKATMFSAGVDLYTRADSLSPSRSPSRSPVRARGASVPVRGRAGGLKPEGYRVRPTDAHTFTALALAEDGLGLGPAVLQRTLIPLGASGSGGSADAPRVFAVPPALPRSPFRPQFPPHGVLSRLRPVANPLLVRLQALQNVCRVYGIQWPGAAGGVREKVVSVAWEGVGRSGLGWEVGAAGAY